MNLFDSLKKWIGQITEVGLLLIALGIVLQLLFGGATVFLTGNIVGNLMELIRVLGDNGLIGLIALVIIVWLFSRRKLDASSGV